LTFLSEIDINISNTSGGKAMGIKCPKRQRVKLMTISLSIFLLIGSNSVIKPSTVDYLMDPWLSYSIWEPSNVVTTLTSGNWDNGYFDVDVGFLGFSFYGQHITNIRVSTNGYIVLGTSATGDGTNFTNDPIPDASHLPNNIFAVYWDDLTFDTDGDGQCDPGRSLRYQVHGTPYAASITLKWRNVSHKNSMRNYSFGIIIGGLINRFWFFYEDVGDGYSVYDYGASATVGIENSLGTRGVEYSYNSTSLSNGQKICFIPYHQVYGASASDYDGDGISDVGVFKTNGCWRIKYSGGGSLSKLWGAKGDIPIVSDFDNDSIADVAVYKHSLGTWRITYSKTALTGSIFWGMPGDTPVPADYDGDGTDDIAVFKPYLGPGTNAGVWRIQYSSGGAGSIFWGERSDIPVPADYDGDGKTDIAVWKRKTGYWRIKLSTGGSITQQWGRNEAIPVPADYDGDGTDDIAVYYPTPTFGPGGSLLGNLWRIKYSSGGSGSINFGFTFLEDWEEESPSPADLDGDLKADLVISSPYPDFLHYLFSYKEWCIKYSFSGLTADGMFWGLRADSPVAK